MNRLVLSSALLALVTACTPPSVPAEPAVSVRVSPDPVVLGQNLTFNLVVQRVSEPLHVAVFVEDPAGHVIQLLPNRPPGGDPILNPGQAVTFPAPGANYALKAALPVGVHTVLAYATPARLQDGVVSAYASDSAAFADVVPGWQGTGSLRGAMVAVLKLHQAGLVEYTTFTVTNP